MTQYTREEVAKHNRVTDCWLVIDSRVYDVTKFLETHPGGANRLLSVAGRDATDSFLLAGHNDAVLRKRGIQYEVGSIKGEDSVDSVPPFPEEDEPSEGEESLTPQRDVDEVERMSIESVHSHLPDASPPAPDDQEEMSFENLRIMMPFGIPDSALRDEVGRMHRAGIFKFGGLSQFTLEELEKIVKPATARTLRHYLKGSLRPLSFSSPATVQAKLLVQADMTVGFLKPLVGGTGDGLEEEVTRLRNKGVLNTGGLAQFSAEDLEKFLRLSTVKALKPYLKVSSQQLSLPPGAASSSSDRALTLALLRSCFPPGVPEAAVQDELTKLHQAGITSLAHLNLRSAEELGAVIRPGTVRALAKYLKGGELQIITEPKKLRAAGGDPSEQALDMAFLRGLLPSGAPDSALSTEINCLHGAGLMKVGDLATKTSEELDKIVRLVTSKALKHLTKDGRHAPPPSRVSLNGSRPAVSAPSSQEINLAFLRSVLPGVPDASLEGELEKLRGATIRTVGDLDRFQVVDLEKIVSITTVRALTALRREPQRTGRELNCAFLGALMPGVPEAALLQEILKLQAQHIMSVEQLEQHTVEELEKFGVRAAAAKALRAFTKGGNGLNAVVSPSLAPRPGVVVPGITLDNWVPSSDINMAFLRSCMPGVPALPLQEEVNKLRSHKILIVGNLSYYSVEEMEKIVKSSTARAMMKYLKNPSNALSTPRGRILSPSLGGGPGGASVPSLALDGFPPSTEVNLAFLRRVLPAGAPDAILQEELNKLLAKGITTVGHMGQFTLTEMEAVVRVGTARIFSRFLKDYTLSPSPRAAVSPSIRGIVQGEPLPALLLATIFPTTEITTNLLRSLMPDTQSSSGGALQDEVLKLRNRNINTVGLLSNYSFQDMERIVLPSTARMLSTFLKQAPMTRSNSAAVSPTMTANRGPDAVPQLTLEAKVPAWTDITLAFLRTVMPNIPDHVLHEEVTKLRQAGITTVGHLANWTMEELERVVKTSTARSLPRYLKPSGNNAFGIMISPSHQPSQTQQSVPSFQLERMKEAVVQDQYPPQAEISLVLLRSVMPGVPDAPLTEELNKLRNKQIRTVGNLSFYTLDEMQSIVRPGTSRALLRFLKGGTASATPTMRGMQQPTIIPIMSLQQDPEISVMFIRPLMPNASEKEMQEDVNMLKGLGIWTVNQLNNAFVEDIEKQIRPTLLKAINPYLKKRRTSITRKSLTAPPPPNNPNQELNIAFLRTLLPAGVPETALQEELGKLKENFILTVNHLSDYSSEDLEKILLKLGTIRALKQYVKGGTAVATVNGSSTTKEDVGSDKNGGELTTQFLASVMPKGVPEAALREELGKLKHQLIYTLFHLSLFTLDDMEKVVRLTTARSLKDYLKGGSIQIPPPVPPPKVDAPDLPPGPPWTNKHAISIVFLRSVMPPGLPDDSLKEEVVKLQRNKIVTVGDVGKYTADEITKLAGMSGWFLKEYAKGGPHCVYVPPPTYIPDPAITLAFMLTLMPPGIPEIIIQDELRKLVTANITTVPDLGLKTTEELSKIVGMSGWFLKDYLKGGPKMLAPNPKPPPEDIDFTDGPEQELSGPFLQSVLPLGIPEDAPEEEAKKFQNAGILNLGRLAQYTAKDIEGIVRLLTVRSLTKFLRPPVQGIVVSPLIMQVSPTMGVRNMEEAVTVSFLRTVMPSGVPLAALQEEVGKLHTKGIWTVGHLAQITLPELEQFVRATTARSLSTGGYLSTRRSSVAPPRNPGRNFSSNNTSGEINVAFLRTVMPPGVPESALQEEVGKMKAKGIDLIGQLSTKTLSEMETIVRTTTARSLRDYLNPAVASASPQPSPQLEGRPPRASIGGGPVDWAKEDISLVFLRAVMPGVPDGPLLEEFNNLRNKAILRVSQLSVYTEYELGQIVRAATVRALKGYLRGTSSSPVSTSSTPSPASADIGPSTTITVSIFRSLMPAVPEALLQAEIVKLQSRGIFNFGDLSEYSPEHLGSLVKPGIARALARFARPSKPYATAPPPAPPASSAASLPSAATDLKPS